MTKKDDKIQYICAVNNIEQILYKLEEDVMQSNRTKAFKNRFDGIKEKIQNSLNIPDILKNTINKKDGKIVIYCNSTDEINYLESIFKDWLSYLNNNIDIYKFYSGNDELMNDYEKWKFLYNNNLNLKILFVSLPIDLSMGLSDINSVIIYRPVKISNDITLFNEKNNFISKVILDIVDGSNVEFETFFEKYKKSLKLYEQLREQLNIINETEIIKELEAYWFKFISSWDWWYSLLIKYYEYNKHIEVPSYFKTKNGYEYDENGYSLGEWLSQQRSVLKQEKLNETQKKHKKLLIKLGMRFENRKVILTTKEKLQLVEAYYNEYKHLKIPCTFRTHDGITYAEDGYRLGNMINRLVKKVVNNKRLTKEEEIQKQFLIKLNFDFSKVKNLKKINWDEWYNLAKSYYDYYKNLNVSSGFKTLNGYEYSESGYSLYNWLYTQNIQLNKNNLNKDEMKKRKKLETIGFNFHIRNTNITFDKVYQLLENYYNKYHKLEIDNEFKTKDGITYCEDGFNLKELLSSQIKSLSKDNLSPKKLHNKRKLEALGIVFKKKKIDVWQRNYNLLQNYYNYYGSLEIPFIFKTKDGVTYNSEGIELGKWAKSQLENLSRIFLSKIEKEQKHKLELIGMEFGMRKPNVFENNEKDELSRKISYLKSIYEELETINKIQKEHISQSRK